MEIILFFLIAFGVLLVFVIGIYNRLITLRNRSDNAWAQVDVQLRRRYDLIPNLVETVKGYAKHEASVFEKVTEARSKAINAGTVKNQNFLMLQEELAGTEGKIAYARQFYNDTVMKFNLRQQVFPSNIIANMFNFKEKEYFEIEEAEAREPVKVKF